MKIKLCKDLIKIISKEFEIEDVAKHLKQCQKCQDDFNSIIENYIKNNPYGAIALNIFKLLKQNQK